MFTLKLEQSSVNESSGTDNRGSEMISIGTGAVETL